MVTFYNLKRPELKHDSTFYSSDWRDWGEIGIHTQCLIWIPRTVGK